MLADQRQVPEPLEPRHRALVRAGLEHRPEAPLELCQRSLDEPRPPLGPRARGSLPGQLDQPAGEAARVLLEAARRQLLEQRPAPDVGLGQRQAAAPPSRRDQTRDALQLGTLHLQQAQHLSLPLEPRLGLRNAGDLDRRQRIEASRKGQPDDLVDTALAASQQQPGRRHRQQRVDLVSCRCRLAHRAGGTCEREEGRQHPAARRAAPQATQCRPRPRACRALREHVGDRRGGIEREPELRGAARQPGPASRAARPRSRRARARRRRRAAPPGSGARRTQTTSPSGRRVVPGDAQLRARRAAEHGESAAPGSAGAGSKASRTARESRPEVRSSARGGSLLRSRNRQSTSPQQRVALRLAQARRAHRGGPSPSSSR